MIMVVLIYNKKFYFLVKIYRKYKELVTTLILSFLNIYSIYGRPKTFSLNFASAKITCLKIKANSFKAARLVLHNQPPSHLYTTTATTTATRLSPGCRDGISNYTMAYNCIYFMFKLY